MDGLAENLCFETHLLVCIAGRVDAGVLSAQSGCLQAVCLSFSMRQMWAGWMVAVVMQAVVAVALIFERSGY